MLRGLCAFPYVAEMNEVHLSDMAVGGSAAREPALD